MKGWSENQKEIDRSKKLNIVYEGYTFKQTSMHSLKNILND